MNLPEATEILYRFRQWRKGERVHFPEGIDKALDIIVEHLKIENNAN